MKINWTILAILVISFFAVSTGYLLNLYNEQADDLKFEIADSEKDLARMESLRDFLLNFDGDKVNFADVIIAQAFAEALEYETLNQTLSVTEREAKLQVIKATLERVFEILNQTSAMEIHRNFLTTNFLGFQYANEINNTFDYTILKEDWEKYTPGEFTNVSTLLQRFGFNASIATNLFNRFGPAFSPTALIFVIEWANLYTLHDTVIFRQADLIESKTIRLSNIQGITNLLSVSVSIATIGTVLSAAMTSRATEKKIEESFQILRKEILEKKGIDPFPKTKRSKLAILGLLLAFSIAFFGLLSAILFLIDPNISISIIPKF